MSTSIPFNGVIAKSAEGCSSTGAFTHLWGRQASARAAKVFSIYLKTVAGMAGNSAGLKHLYPPIDRQLLVGICGRAENGKSVPFHNWTQMGEEEHAAIIEAIRGLPQMQGEPLWKAEVWWG